MAAIAEEQEPEVALRQMTDGHNVIEDYSHTGLTLRQHPVAFLRTDLLARNITTCADAMNARDGRWVYTAGLVLVRQKPGSAKGVMFITIEDETRPANIVVWPSRFENRRRVVLGSSMMAIHGRIQREGEVVHLVAQQLFDLSGDLVGLAPIATKSSSCRLVAATSLPRAAAGRIHATGQSRFSRGTCSRPFFTSKR
jgi:error-prone DNA polymerase